MHYPSSEKGNNPPGKINSPLFPSVIVTQDFLKTNEKKSEKMIALIAAKNNFYPLSLEIQSG